MKRRLINNHEGMAVVIVTLLILLMMIGTVMFLKRSTTFLAFSGAKSDVISAQFQMNAAYMSELSKLNRAINYNSTTGTGIILNGRLHFVGGPALETFNNISNTYSANQLGFLQSLITQQAWTGAGVHTTSNEFNTFSTAFPSTWTDPGSSDSQYFEVQYTFTPIDMVNQSSPEVLTFEYEYRLQVRAYGQKHYQSVGAEDAGVISVTVQGAPFSKYAAFMNSMKNQNGSTLVFAGGNTSAQVQEIYGGPVHVNQTPNFYGHPTFTDQFTSAIASSSWVYYNVSGYTSCPSQCPTFTQGSIGGVPSISMPTAIFNTERLAAGDTSSTASTNTSAPTNADLNNYLATYANGTLAAGNNPVPNGIYIPIDNSTNKDPTGGIFVKGDSQIQMNVVTGSSQITSAEFNQLNIADQGCKFQKVSITSLDATVHGRDVFIGAGTCMSTYVFDKSNTSLPPVVLNGRLNGNIHVDGKIDQLGGESRTNPAVAQDFGITISATKDVRIINDLQYEDASYYTVAADGTKGSTVVSTPTGAANGSGIAPTAADLQASIPSSSSTVLGIISLDRNVLIHSSAPANINIHAAIFAGNSAAYDSTTGYGCGSSGANTQGCGFGYEGWNTNTGMGQIKFLGSLSEYKDQTTGVLSSPVKGYTSRYFYDTRFRNGLTPPAFPVTDSPTAVGTIKPFKTWRLSQASP